MTQIPKPQQGIEDSYAQHRLALLPLSALVPPADLPATIDTLGAERFFAFLSRHGLGQVWRVYLEGLHPSSQLEQWMTPLRENARLTAAHQMIQRRAVAQLAELLRENEIAWFLFKGADLREWLYHDPVLRPVSDIDFFIDAADREHVIELAGKLNFELHTNPSTVSHELTLLKKNVSIDLHWHLFRPGRARPGLNTWLFEHREKHDTQIGLDATASLLVMLVHPAITKYLISPTSLLIHAVDQARLIQSGRIDWDELARALNRYGTKTAAWSSLYVLRHLAGLEAPGGFMERIQPGRLHAAYLQQWIDRALITKYFERRRLVAGFFSLALQDSVQDIATALRVKAAVSNPPLPDLS